MLFAFGLMLISVSLRGQTKGLHGTPDHQGQRRDDKHGEQGEVGAED